MRRILWSIGLVAGLLVMVLQSVRSQSETKKAGPADPDREKIIPKPVPVKERAADDAAIRANVAAFVRAYNVGDAKAIAALFVEDGYIIDKEGATAVGRDAIQKVFAKLFKDAPKRRLEVDVESIRFIGTDLAVEIGTTKEIAAPGEPPNKDQYTALHVKRGGKWLMALARDSEGDPPTHHERLKPLAWLIGEWVDDGGSIVVHSTCRWSEDKNFLLQEFNMQIEEKSAMKISQRIGWDPLAERIRSWVFDSEGGYGESVWTQDGDVWVIKATAVRPDGTSGSATNQLVPTGRDGYVWRSTDRIVSDEVVPPIEVKVVRKAPQPKQ